ncbi:hypothetical protein QTP88_022313 [Uroleucon formosanum]
MRKTVTLNHQVNIPTQKTSTQLKSCVDGIAFDKKIEEIADANFSTSGVDRGDGRGPNVM